MTATSPKTYDAESKPVYEATQASYRCYQQAERLALELRETMLTGWGVMHGEDYLGRERVPVQVVLQRQEALVRQITASLHEGLHHAREAIAIAGASTVRLTSWDRVVLDDNAEALLIGVPKDSA